jgi:hypothetical protein
MISMTSPPRGATALFTTPTPVVRLAGKFVRHANARRAFLNAVLGTPSACAAGLSAEPRKDDRAEDHGQECSRWRPERHTAAAEAGQAKSCHYRPQSILRSHGMTLTQRQVATRQRMSMLPSSGGGLGDSISGSGSRAPPPAPPPVRAPAPALRRPAG